MKIPQRGEIWKADDVDIYYYIVSLDKFSVNCVTFNYVGTFGVYRISTFNFLKHHHFLGDSETDVGELFSYIVRGQDNE